MTISFKTTMVFILTLTSVVLFAFYFLARISESHKAPGLKNGKLTACPNKPNCLCSESSSNFKANIEAIQINPETDKAPLDTLEKIILDMGGQILNKDETYLSSVFKSKVFGFIDDLELRWDASQKKVHLRSASRVGYSDLGINEKRIRVLISKYSVNL